MSVCYLLTHSCCVACTAICAFVFFLLLNFFHVGAMSLTDSYHFSWKKFIRFTHLVKGLDRAMAGRRRREMKLEGEDNGDSRDSTSHEVVDDDDLETAFNLAAQAQSQSQSSKSLKDGRQLPLPMDVVPNHKSREYVESLETKSAIGIKMKGFILHMIALREAREGEIKASVKNDLISRTRLDYDIHLDVQEDSEEGRGQSWKEVTISKSEQKALLKEKMDNILLVNPEDGGKPRYIAGECTIAALKESRG